MLSRKLFVLILAQMVISCDLVGNKCDLFCNSITIDLFSLHQRYNQLRIPDSGYILQNAGRQILKDLPVTITSDLSGCLNTVCPNFKIKPTKFYATITKTANDIVSSEYSSSETLFTFWFSDSDGTKHFYHHSKQNLEFPEISQISNLSFNEKNGFDIGCLDTIYGEIKIYW